MFLVGQARPAIWQLRRLVATRCRARLRPWPPALVLPWHCMHRAFMQELGSSGVTLHSCRLSHYSNSMCCPMSTSRWLELRALLCVLLWCHCGSALSSCPRSYETMIVLRPTMADEERDQVRTYNASVGCSGCCCCIEFLVEMLLLLRAAACTLADEERGMFGGWQLLLPPPPLLACCYFVCGNAPDSAADSTLVSNPSPSAGAGQVPGVPAEAGRDPAERHGARAAAAGLPHQAVRPQMVHLHSHCFARSDLCGPIGGGCLV